MRPTWNEYFMQFARLAAKRSTCLRRSVGCVLVRDNHILSSGYNGAPCGIKHCTQDTCLRTKFHVPSGERTELCSGLHAEWNTIIHASASLQGATLYSTTEPCSICVKMLINAGIKTIYYDEPYNDELAKELLKSSKIESIQY